jgi:hypothetical protein
MLQQAQAQLVAAGPLGDLPLASMRQTCLELAKRQAALAMELVVALAALFIQTAQREGNTGIILVLAAAVAAVLPLT